MSQARRSFRVEAIDYSRTALADLRAVRDAVFVQEQGVPVEIERDALDPLCVHVIARDDQGQPIGTGRLTPDHRIGRMAVLPDWRGQGVGDALLQALLAQARQLGWPAVSLHAQVPAIVFYARQGFLPYGERFCRSRPRPSVDAAGRWTRSMPWSAATPRIAAVLGVIASARRRLCIYSRELDPGLLDQPEVLAQLRRFAVAGGEVRILLQDPAAPQRAIAPLLGLAQRLHQRVRPARDRGTGGPRLSRAPTSSTTTAAGTSARSATASMARPGSTTRPAPASCAPTSSRSGNAPGLAASTGRWAMLMPHVGQLLATSVPQPAVSQPCKLASLRTTQRYLTRAWLRRLIRHKC